MKGRRVTGHRQMEGVMANMIVVVLCMASEGFLVYVLFHFVRELRKVRAAGAAVDVVLSREAFGEDAPENLNSAKVIEIADWSRVSRRGRDRRKVS
jgi:hypothetical protein